MAHKKAGGSTRNGRDSNPKYLGVKLYGGQAVDAGNIAGRRHGGVHRQGPRQAPHGERARWLIPAAKRFGRPRCVRGFSFLAREKGTGPRVQGRSLRNLGRRQPPLYPEPYTLDPLRR